MTGTDNVEVTGGCYCGEVRFQIRADVEPLISGYCHCIDCRQAHAAPIYEVAWIPSPGFEVTSGQASLKWYTRSERSRAHLRRYFCVNCGTKVFNTYEGPFGGQEISATGIFPTLFDDQRLARSERWAPRAHMHARESLVDLTQFGDGLAKLPGAADAS